MSGIPHEILHAIFIQLSLHQRLECTLVCRSWYTVLFKRSLLYKVSINSQRKHDNFIDMLQRHPSRGNQVEILIIGNRIKKVFDNRRFCNMLPNLRVFKFDIMWSGNPSGKSFELVNPNTKLEVIKEAGDSEFIALVLGSSTCTRLRELDLTFPISGGDYRNYRKGCFPFIQGMPALKKLTLNYGRIGIQDFECLHSKAPALESLKLSDVSLCIGKLPDNIVPATSVTSFRMEILSIEDNQNQSNWYTYMARKYTGLIDFDCNNMELRDIDSDAAMIIYRDGFIPIYKTLGSHLFDVNVVNIPLELDLFNQLDHFGCQIEICYIEDNYSTPIFTLLGQSKQAHYVEYLNLTSTMVTLPSLFQNMTSLSELDIDTTFDEGFYDINLNEYLNAFPPTLIKFSANCTDLEVTNVPTRSSNIRRFHITCPILPKILGQVVSTCFPRLVDLDLRGQVPENISFNLPTHHFQSITLLTESEKYSNSYSFKYTNNPQTVYYFDENNPNGRIIEPTAAEEFQNSINVEFKCASAKKLWLDSGRFNGMS